MRNGLLVFFSFLSALAAQAAPPPRKHSHSHVHKKPAPPVAEVFKTNQGPLPSETKIFLVAGSSLSSSFAREIIEQKQLWLKAGFRESEIACYYVVPFQEDFNDETKAFSALAGELSKCFPANMKLLRQHLAKVGTEKTRPPFVYLYVSSHGEQPVSETFRQAKPSEQDYWQLQRETRYGALDQYHMMLEGMADGTASQLELLGALRAGTPAEDLFLTPKHLRPLLERAFAGVPKFVVLQGCFSGGFVEDPHPARKSDLLSTLPDVTVLTAARYDRSSFGCEPGNGTTFFGGAYNEALGQFVGNPREINWRALWESTLSKVVQLEKREKVTPPSLPVFFSNRPATQGAPRRE